MPPPISGDVEPRGYFSRSWEWEVNAVDVDVDDVNTFPEMFSYMTPYVIGLHGASLALCIS